MSFDWTYELVSVDFGAGVFFGGAIDHGMLTCCVKTAVISGFVMLSHFVTWLSAEVGSDAVCSNSLYGIHDDYTCLHEYACWVSDEAGCGAGTSADS